jgi:TRAP-type C4-dicarboxylate transport system permease small subunit
VQQFASLVSTASRWCGFLAVALVVSAVVVICQLLWIRWVLGQSAIWQNEYVTFALIAATFVGAPYVLLTRGHVNVDLVPLWARGRTRHWLSLLASAVGLVFCLILFVTSLPWWWEAWEGGFTTSSVWRAPLWIPYLSVPVGTGLLVLQYIVEIWATATGRALPFGLAPGELGGVHEHLASFEHIQPHETRVAGGPP